MRVAVLFDGEQVGKAPDLLIRETVRAVEKELATLGYEAIRVPARPDGRWIERVRTGKFDLVFNLCEGVDGVPELEPAVASTLECMGVPYTGCPSYTLNICLRKHLVNALLERAGVNVAPWALVRKGDPLPKIAFPAICKPAAEDASVGIDQGAVVRNRKELKARLAFMHEHWNEILVQRFVAGREFNVGIVGDTVLPISEIDFGDMPAGKWRIVTFISKWAPGTDEDLGAMPRCPAPIPKRMAANLERAARRAWDAVQGSGFGRVDMRVDAKGRPWILEVNPNPDFSPNAGLARMGAAAGLDYTKLVGILCDAAFARARATPENTERWEISQRVAALSENGTRAVARRASSPAAARTSN